MTPLAKENLELKIEDTIAYMTLSGTVAQDDMDEGLTWFDELCEAQDTFNICVEMAKDDFEDLGEVSAEFKRVARTLRRAVNAKKCAVLTDSMFLRNSAKVEGAVIPGIELLTFKLKSKDAAVKWLQGEPLLESDEDDAEIEPAKDVAPQAPQAGLSKDVPSNDSSSNGSNPWDNLDLQKVDL